MLNYPVGSQRTTLSDRNGPSCPSLSDFDYILYLLSADLDFKLLHGLLMLPGKAKFVSCSIISLGLSF